jgi:hypothetical protein
MFKNILSVFTVFLILITSSYAKENSINRLVDDETIIKSIEAGDSIEMVVKRPTKWDLLVRELTCVSDSQLNVGDTPKHTEVKHMGNKVKIIIRQDDGEQLCTFKMSPHNAKKTVAISCYLRKNPDPNGNVRAINKFAHKVTSVLTSAVVWPLVKFTEWTCASFSYMIAKAKG